MQTVRMGSALSCTDTAQEHALSAVPLPRSGNCSVALGLDMATLCMLREPTGQPLMEP